MKKLNIKDSFKSKNFRFGGYATLMTSIVLAILIVINLVVGQLNLKMDLTKNKLYSLSDQTFKTLDNLNQDITIYGLYETGKEAPAFDEILRKYSDYSNKIHIEYKDPILYPQFSAQYDKNGEGIKTGSLIVVGKDNKFKVINAYDLVNYSYNQQTYEPQADSLAVEQRVTGAIQYVTAAKNPKLYTLVGHNETALTGDILKQLEQENYEVADLNLLTEGKIPEDADVLLVSSPKRDVSKDEAKYIKDFLSNEGRAIFLIDLTQNEMPNLSEVMKSYGVNTQHDVILEGSKQYQSQNPRLIIPNQEDHEILSPLTSKKLSILMYDVQGIEILDAKRDSIEVESLLTTSDTSYGKVNLQSQTIEKEDGDLQGPFNVAVAITDKWYNDENKELKTKLVVVGNAQFMSPQINAYTSGANSDFFFNSLNWLQGKEQNITIRPKSLKSEYLNINEFQALLFSGISAIVIPLIIIIIGFVVWMRRKNR